jgi:hypothetical protein
LPSAWRSTTRRWPSSAARRAMAPNLREGSRLRNRHNSPRARGQGEVHDLCLTFGAPHSADGSAGGSRQAPTRKAGAVLPGCALLYDPTRSNAPRGDFMASRRKSLCVGCRCRFEALARICLCRRDPESVDRGHRAALVQHPVAKGCPGPDRRSRLDVPHRVESQDPRSDARGSSPSRGLADYPEQAIRKVARSQCARQPIEPSRH